MKIRKLYFVILFILMGIYTNAHQNDSIFTFRTVKTLYPVLSEKTKSIHTPIPTFVEGVKQTSISLNGSWLFTNKIDSPFDGKKKTNTQWHTINVPSEWYMESFQVEPGKWAGYYKEFSLPSDWINQKTLLRFGAVESECRIFLNGKYVGGHIGSMTQFEKELTPYLSSGKNQLMVYVRSESLASEISKISHYAKHQAGGILRGVELISVPQTYINDLYCDAKLSDNLDQGTLNIHVSLSGKQKNQKVEVTVKERGIEGLPMNEKIVYNEKMRLKQLNPVIINTPKLWHAETPFLYTVEVALFKDNEKTEVIKKNFGFRKIEIKGNILYVNNQPVKLRGVSPVSYTHLTLPTILRV